MDCFPTHPLLNAPTPREPIRISGMIKYLRHRKLPYGENSTILTSTVSDWSTRVTDRRMGDADSISRYANKLSRSGEETNINEFYDVVYVQEAKLSLG